MKAWRRGLVLAAALAFGGVGSVSAREPARKSSQPPANLDISGAPDTNTGQSGINSGLGHIGTQGSTGNSFGGSGQDTTRSVSSNAGAPNYTRDRSVPASGQYPAEYGAPSPPDTGYGDHGYLERPGQADLQRTHRLNERSLRTGEPVPPIKPDPESAGGT